MAMVDLPDELLIEAYTQAVKLKLDHEFISLLASEIRERKLEVKKPLPQTSPKTKKVKVHHL